MCGKHVNNGDNSCPSPVGLLPLAKNACINLVFSAERGPGYKTILSFVDNGQKSLGEV